MGKLIAPPDAEVRADVARALAEDIGSGDVTASLLPDVEQQGYVIAKEAAIVAGRPWFDACLLALDPGARIEWRVDEGASVANQAVVCTFHGRSRALLSAERCALNFLQTLSATATRAAEYVAAVAGTGARILDTRKTLPGLRLAQKYAVRAGGGDNHRVGLYDAMMLKENHIHAAGSLRAAALQARQRYPALPLIIEVENLAELAQALDVGCDRILIDDFTLADMREAVRIAAGRIPLEVSGGVELSGVREIAQTGVDCISVGALTKHVRAVDFSMRLGAAP
jgi:nicotinate-nucleotide pyrophosphorylase (carboxylating)